MEFYLESAFDSNAVGRVFFLSFCFDSFHWYRSHRVERNLNFNHHHFNVLRLASCWAGQVDAGLRTSTCFYISNLIAEPILHGNSCTALPFHLNRLEFRFTSTRYSDCLCVGLWFRIPNPWKIEIEICMAFYKKRVPTDVAHERIRTELIIIIWMSILFIFQWFSFYLLLFKLSGVFLSSDCRCWMSFCIWPSQE